MGGSDEIESKSEFVLTMRLDSSSHPNEADDLATPLVSNTLPLKNRRSSSKRNSLSTDQSVVSMPETAKAKHKIRRSNVSSQEIELDEKETMSVPGAQIYTKPKKGTRRHSAGGLEKVKKEKRKEREKKKRSGSMGALGRTKESSERRKEREKKKQSGSEEDREAQWSDGASLSPSINVRTTVGSDGKIRRLNSSKKLHTNVAESDERSVSSRRSKSKGNKKEIEMLQSKILELTEEQIIIQTEARKRRKELREEKLELQRCQTERRELRAQLRESEFIIEEADRKIEALEKAVESQLGKVEDLEDELRRANEEIFLLEAKLSHMESVLTDSEKVKNVAEAKEMAFNERSNERRQQRLERRLLEKEKELEARERQLIEKRKKLFGAEQKKRESEQDNMMLLKTLNREKSGVDEVLKEKDSEIEDLRRQLMIAKQTPLSSSAEPGATTTMIKNIDDFQEKLRAEQTKSVAALQKKDDTIASMELELNKLKSELESRDLGDFSKLKGELEASKAEAQVMKSKYDDAQRQNRDLEDDIHHWKTVNIGLEEELANCKTEVANWRSKYEDEEIVVGDGNFDHSLQDISFALRRDTGHQRSAAQMAIQSNDDLDGITRNSISNLWSKLTTPTSKKNNLASNQLNAGLLNVQLDRSSSQ